MALTVVEALPEPRGPVVPTALDNGHRSPRTLLAQVVRRLLSDSRSDADDHEERDDARESESDPDRNGD
jgi:hypothetical protein